jgi:hypothetical protein
VHQIQKFDKITEELTDKGIFVRMKGMKKAYVEQEETTVEEDSIFVDYQKFAGRSQLSCKLVLENKVVNHVLSFPQIHMESDPIMQVVSTKPMKVQVLANCSAMLSNGDSKVRVGAELVEVTPTIKLLSGQQIQLQQTQGQERVFEVEEKHVPKLAGIDCSIRAVLFGREHQTSKFISWDNSQLVKISTFVYSDEITCHFFNDHEAFRDLDVFVNVDSDIAVMMRTDEEGFLNIKYKGLCPKTVKFTFTVGDKSFKMQKNLSHLLGQEVPSVVVQKGKSLEGMHLKVDGKLFLDGF